MDVPPTYQEATSSNGKKQNWLKRFVSKLFKRSPPQPGLLVERKLIHPYQSTSTSSTKPSKSSKSSKSTATSTTFITSTTRGFHPPAWINTDYYRNSLHQTHNTSLSPPTNYVRIKRSNAPITGVWNIDTSLVVPKELLVPFKDKTEKRHHLHLWSEGERIDADVNVVEGEGGGEETVLLTASSEGRVSLRITKPDHRRLSVFCRGSIISIRIPRSYRGTLKAHSGTGSVFFSEGVNRSVRSIYEKGKESRWFIGKMDSTGSVRGDVKEGGEEGKYDVMKLKAKSRVGENYGEIFVAYEDEDELVTN